MHKIVTVVIILLVISGITFLIADRTFLDTRIGKGAVTKKQYFAEYETESCYDVGEYDEICEDVVHPERWELTVKYKNETDVVNVDEKFYDKSFITETVSISFTIYGFTKGISIKKIRRINY